jgi:hypothetical protein
MSTRWLAVVMFAWILWVDQTSYTLPSGPGDTTPIQLEGATGRWQQLAITETRAECRALRRARPGRRRARYKDKNRFFCSPVGDGGGR